MHSPRNLGMALKCFATTVRLLGLVQLVRVSSSANLLRSTFFSPTHLARVILPQPCAPAPACKPDQLPHPYKTARLPQSCAPGTPPPASGSAPWPGGRLGTCQGAACSRGSGGINSASRGELLASLLPCTKVLSQGRAHPRHPTHHPLTHPQAHKCTLSMHLGALTHTAAQIN